MRALGSDRQNCSHSVSQKVKHIRRLSEISTHNMDFSAQLPAKTGPGSLTPKMFAFSLKVQPV